MVEAREKAKVLANVLSTAGLVPWRSLCPGGYERRRGPEAQLRAGR
jgi:hypothetical protein